MTTATVPRFLGVQGRGTIALPADIRRRHHLDEPGAQVEVIEQARGWAKLKVVLGEGRNRQIRRLCEDAGLGVSWLKRVAIGDVRLGSLSPGEWRHMPAAQVKALTGR